MSTEPREQCDVSPCIFHPCNGRLPLRVTAGGHWPYLTYPTYYEVIQFLKKMVTSSPSVHQKVGFWCDETKQAAPKIEQTRSERIANIASSPVSTQRMHLTSHSSCSIPIQQFTGFGVQASAFASTPQSAKVVCEVQSKNLNPNSTFPWGISIG